MNTSLAKKNTVAQRNPDQWQQGDICGQRVSEIPADAVFVNGGLVALGEGTGHKHEVADTALVRLFRTRDSAFMEVLPGAQVVHDEHNTVELLPGKYAIGRVNQFNHKLQRREPVFD